MKKVFVKNIANKYKNHHLIKINQKILISLFNLTIKLNKIIMFHSRIQNAIYSKIRIKEINYKKLAKINLFRNRMENKINHLCLKKAILNNLFKIVK